MSRWRVLLNKPIHPDALRRLEEQTEPCLAFEATQDELVSLLPQVDAILLGVGFYLGPVELGRGSRLVVIGRHGVGLDNVDVAAATERAIPVTYTPYGPTESTAEHAFLLMLSVARRLSQMDHALRTGDFGIRLRNEAMGRELQGMILGIVGFGRIGQRLAEMCRAALDMEIRVYDPFVDAESIAAWGATPVPRLVDLASQVDILSIHAPLSQATRHLIDRTVLRAMKPGALLINTSRGPVVDQQALRELLLDGHLGGAGLDVFDPQPPDPADPLLGLDQVVLTPHIASFTRQGRQRMGLTVVEDIVRALRGDRPRFLANPQVWPHRRFKMGPTADQGDSE
jgi:phosphoglycerate dehydrogenase-like enzyme